MLEFLRRARHQLGVAARRALFRVEPPFTAEQPGAEARRRSEALSRSDLGRLFLAHRGRPTQKWIGYPEAYDRQLALWRGEPGQAAGDRRLAGRLAGDLARLSRGPRRVIFGIDIDPACAARVDAPNQVRIGSQADPSFLRGVVEEMGGVDIVIDDGSHVAQHQRVSFRTLFPLLSDGGLYVVEDTHSSYWPGFFQGGVRRRGTAVEMAKELIDDLHRHWHWQRRPSHGDVHAVHTYDSVFFVEKRRQLAPARIAAPEGVEPCVKLGRASLQNKSSSPALCRGPIWREPLLAFFGGGHARHGHTSFGVRRWRDKLRP